MARWAGRRERGGRRPVRKALAVGQAPGDVRPLGLGPPRYEILVGSSSADIRATLPLVLEKGDLPPRTFTVDDVFGDICRDPQGRAVADFLIDFFGRARGEPVENENFAAMLANLPFKKLVNLSGGKVDDSMLDRLLEIVHGDLPPDRVPAAVQAILATPPR